MATKPAGRRRAPYGDNPRVGRLGLRSRAAIMAAARDVLSERGYQETSVEEIALRCARTPAGVYQYFAGKDAIFEAFVQELSADLLRQAGRLGRLGPDEAGVDELRMWVSGLGLIFRRHAQTYLLWPAVGEEGQLEALVSEVVERFAVAVAPRLPEHLTPAEARGFALTMLAVIDNAHTLVAQGWPCDETELTETLARVFQLALWPESYEVLEAVAPPWSRGELGPPRESSARVLTAAGPSGLRRPVGPKAQLTVDHLLAEAGRLVARRGLSGTSISDIAAAAQMSHGRIYTYWANLEDLAATLSATSRDVLLPLLSSGVDALAEADIAGWTHDWFAAFPATAAGMRLWQSREVTDPRILADRDAVLAEGHLLLQAATDASGTADLIGPRARAFVAVATLQVPMQAMYLHAFADGHLDATLISVVGASLLGFDPELAARPAQRRARS